MAHSVLCMKASLESFKEMIYFPLSYSRENVY